MKPVIIAALVVLALVLLHLLATWAEKRGWIYYRKGSGSAGLGNAMLNVQSLIEPERQYIIEAREETAEESDSGDPPESGTGKS